MSPLFFYSLLWLFSNYSTSRNVSLCIIWLVRLADDYTAVTGSMDEGESVAFGVVFNHNAYMTDVI